MINAIKAKQTILIRPQATQYSHQPCVVQISCVFSVQCVLSCDFLCPWSPDFTHHACGTIIRYVCIYGPYVHGCMKQGPCHKRCYYVYLGVPASFPRNGTGETVSTGSRQWSVGGIARSRPPFIWNEMKWAPQVEYIPWLHFIPKGKCKCCTLHSSFVLKKSGIDGQETVTKTRASKMCWESTVTSKQHQAATPSQPKILWQTLQLHLAW